MPPTRQFAMFCNVWHYFIIYGGIGALKVASFATVADPSSARSSCLRSAKCSFSLRSRHSGSCGTTCFGTQIFDCTDVSKLRAAGGHSLLSCCSRSAWCENSRTGPDAQNLLDISFGLKKLFTSFYSYDQPLRLHVIDAVMIFRENIRPEWEDHGTAHHTSTEVFMQGFCSVQSLFSALFELPVH